MSPSRRSLHLGAAYYPEQWPEARWAEDVRLMREAGFTVSRLAEFAWSTLEPEAGRFDFGWLDRAIDLLAGNGIATVLGTPTAAPPAWLVQQHPELMAVGEDGRRVQFGNRCHYCVNAPELHEATRRIAGAMAEHFGSNPHVTGWQLDNEYNRVCYCDRCQADFQRFLEGRFGTLEALNAAWTTGYWSQTYSDWAQIPIPRGRHNPGLMLAFKQFVTESYRRFQQLQIDLLRPHLRDGVWITHNFMGWFPGYDHYKLAEPLDMVSWDWYIGSGHHDYLRTGAIHDLTRGFKRQNFWLIETQPGSVNWSGINNSLNQGEARAMAWHAVAHGADAILYWQWRSALGGQEQYHGTLVDQSGQPRPFYEEAQQLGADFAAIGPLLAGSTVPAEVALLNDYESRWSITWQPHHEDFDYVAHFTHYYRPLAARNIASDVISAGAGLAGYALVIAPALLILDDGRAEALADYAHGGGHLLLTARTGMKDRDNALLAARQPGPLRAAAGVEVEDYYALLEPVPVAGPGLDGTAQQWAERLRPLDGAQVEVWARYGPSNGWLDGQPAVTAHRYGAGMVYYTGAYLDGASQQVLLDRIAAGAGVTPTLPAPPGVEVGRRRRADGEDIYLLVNHTRAAARMALPWPAHDHLGGQGVDGTLLLPPYGVAVLTRNRT
jgi:beta-galactosidase